MSSCIDFFYCFVCIQYIYTHMYIYVCFFSYWYIWFQYTDIFIAWDTTCHRCPRCPPSYGFKGHHAQPTTGLDTTLRFLRLPLGFLPGANQVKSRIKSPQSLMKKLLQGAPVWWPCCCFFCFQLTKKPTWKGSMAIATPMYCWKSWARIRIATFWEWRSPSTFTMVYMVAADVVAFFLGGKAAEVGKVGGWVSACIWCVLGSGSGWAACGVLFMPSGSSDIMVDPHFDGKYLEFPLGMAFLLVDIVCTQISKYPFRQVCI